MMKKIFAILLAACLVFSFAACDRQEIIDVDKQPSPSKPQATIPTSDSTIENEHPIPTQPTESNDETKDVGHYKSSYLKLYSNSKLKYHMLHGKIVGLSVDKYGLAGVFTSDLLYVANGSYVANYDFSVYNISKDKITYCDYINWMYIQDNSDGTRTYYAFGDSSSMKLDIEGGNQVYEDVQVNYYDVIEYDVQDTSGVVVGVIGLNTAGTCFIIDRGDSVYLHRLENGISTPLTTADGTTVRDYFNPQNDSLVDCVILENNDMRYVNLYWTVTDEISTNSMLNSIVLSNVEKYYASNSVGMIVSHTDDPTALYCHTGTNVYELELPSGYAVDDIKRITSGDGTMFEMNDHTFYMLRDADFIGNNASKPIALQPMTKLNELSDHILDAACTDDGLLVVMDDYCLYVVQD